MSSLARATIALLAFHAAAVLTGVLVLHAASLLRHGDQVFAPRLFAVIYGFAFVAFLPVALSAVAVLLWRGEQVRLQFFAHGSVAVLGFNALVLLALLASPLARPPQLGNIVAILMSTLAGSLVFAILVRAWIGAAASGAGAPPGRGDA